MADEKDIKGAVEYQLEKIDQGGDITDLFEDRTEWVAKQFDLPVNDDAESPYFGMIRLPDGRYVGLQFDVIVIDPEKSASS